MEVFRHHIYEFKKGLRNLILHTAPLSDVPEIERSLQAQGIAYRMTYLKNGHVNVFSAARTAFASSRSSAKTVSATSQKKKISFSASCSATGVSKSAGASSLSARRRM